MAASSSECEIVQEEGDNGTDVKGEASTLLIKSKQTMVEGPGTSHAFNARMHALMIECKEGLKKDRKSGKKVMMEWIEGHDNSKESLEIVTIMKAQVDNIGIEFFRMLSDFLFAVWIHENGSENIKRFKSALLWVSAGVDSPVIDEILAMVVLIDGAMTEIKGSKEARNKALKGKLPAASEETGLDDSNQKESSSESSRLTKLGDPFTQDYISELFDKFLEAGLRLEAIISHPTLAESGFSLTEALAYMANGDLREADKAVESVVKEMEKLEETELLNQVRKDVRTWEIHMLVEMNTYELWHRLQFQASNKKKQSDGGFLWCWDIFWSRAISSIKGFMNCFLHDGGSR